MSIADFFRKIGILRTGGDVVQEDTSQKQVDSPVDNPGDSQPDAQDTDSFDDNTTE